MTNPVYIKDKICNFNDKILVVVNLNGGNDGLFALAPKSNDTIDSHRKIMMGELRKGIEWEGDFLLKKLFNMA